MDFDGMPFASVLYLAHRTLRWFRRDHKGKTDLEGFIILKSSANHYHVVYNALISWPKNLHIIAWIAQRVKNRSLNGYVIMQAIKECSTLRVGSKGDKPTPRIVYRYGKQDRQIRVFLVYRKLVLKLERELKAK
jgi:hypothetical protein